MVIGRFGRYYLLIEELLGLSARIFLWFFLLELNKMLLFGTKYTYYVQATSKNAEVRKLLLILDMG